MQTNNQPINQRVLLIITGSIAAYKTIDLARDLQEAGYELTIIITQGGSQFVAPLPFSALTNANIIADHIFDSQATEVMQHINLAKQHNLIMVAPASADFIAKAACGIADTLALCTLIATQTNVIIAPAMNPNMWESKSTQDNLSKLKNRGIIIAEPIDGRVACGDTGIGKYIGNTALLKLIKQHNTPVINGPLKNKTVIITLGATHEKIDPVRYIGNYSSGHTGTLIVKNLLAQGCKVNVIAGHIDVDLPPETNIHRAYTAQEMKEKSKQLLPCDIYIGCAAICDYKPTETYNSKIKKSDQPLKLEFEPTTDVLSYIGNNTKRPTLVIGFALESENLIQNATNKLESKGLDIIICNKIEHLGKDFNDYTIITKRNKKNIGAKSKTELANLLVTEINKYFSSN